MKAHFMFVFNLFNTATTKSEITYMNCVVFLLDSIALDRGSPEFPVAKAWMGSCTGLFNQRGRLHDVLACWLGATAYSGCRWYIGSGVCTYGLKVSWSAKQSREEEKRIC